MTDPNPFPQSSGRGPRRPTFTRTATDLRVLVVDDEPTNLLLLERFLARWGYTNVVTTTDSSEVVGLVEREQVDVVLLDLIMPHPDGFEVMRQLAERDTGAGSLPILVLTADASPTTRERALTMGASDFVTKPFDRTEVRLRVENLLKIRLLQLETEEYDRLLERRVRDRTREAEVGANEVLERLAMAGEYRSDETHEHPQRVGRTAALLAAELGLPPEEVALIRRAAPLHDVGNLGVPDSILLKPGPLTSEEFEAMRRHTLVGSEILAGSASPVLQSGATIARTHHERWDGGGYPAGLAGDAIPLFSRLVTVADVFDALTRDRPYKPAVPLESAVAEIRRVAGSQLDPRVAESFERLDQRRLVAPIDEFDIAVPDGA
jgi:putative two-component system response regulator